MKLNISLSHTRVKGQAATPHEILLAIINQSERSEELIRYLFFINNVKLKLYIKISTTDFLNKTPHQTPNLWILTIMGIFASPLLKITWPMAHFLSQISVLSSQLSGNHRRCLKEHKKWLVLIWRKKKKSWGTRQLLVAECYFFFSLCLHIFTTYVLCYPVTSLSSLGKYLCFGIKEGPGVLLVRTALALICCFWTEHIQWTHFKLGPLPS